ncbi:MAG: hypothetical protein SVM86_01415 [Candidatus Cloacimonadota bacterium]|nr:hypothetical protein [Candidatus Cloacimonadota bacterium]
MFIPFIASYAEVHYHLKYLFPKYFTSFPEIITDIPFRLCLKRTSKLPVLLIIKDADKFPIKLLEIEIKILGYNSYKEIFNKKISQSYFSLIIPIELSDFKPGKYELITEIKVAHKGKTYLFINDNYKNLTPQPYVFEIVSDTPFPENWYAGELHYHSSYTSDQVEFGADISSTTTIAKAMGLDWFSVTDHSYDLDDNPENFLQTDPNLKKWKMMQHDVKANDSDECRIIAGEELSVGNCEGKNIHLLILNNKEFIYGTGDSAEKWFKNKPTINLSELKKEKQALYIAAHPNEKVPFLQKISLRRGNWQISDLVNTRIEFLQIINGHNKVDRNIEFWKSLLLQGYKFMILAGNDAHGNFNQMRQIAKPFLKLINKNEQLFGKWQTVFHYNQNTPLKGLLQRKIIVSNGPFLNFWLEKNKNMFYIGNTIEPGKYKLHWETFTNSEFGKFKEIKINLGYNGSEKQLLNLKNGSLISLKTNSYIRMSGKTKKGGKVFCNPIWID